MNEDRPSGPAGMAGPWTLYGPTGQACELLLLDTIAEPRAAGSVPPEMRGARMTGDCGMERRIGGWRMEGASLVLVDHYGLAVSNLAPDGEGGYQQPDAGVRLSRP